MPLLFEHLDNCFATYQEAFAVFEQQEEGSSLYKLIRDSLVKRFEYTWDAYVKAIERCLVEDLANSDKVKDMTYKELIVEAKNKGYISDVGLWLDYRKLRNKTSHTYFEEHAEKIAENAQGFLNELKIYMPVLKHGHEDLSLNGY